MANTFNTGTYEQVWATKLQERLNAPSCWKEICEVIYSDKQVINLPYMSTEYTLQSGTRGTAYSHSDFALTNDTLTINKQDIVSVFQDRADLAQSSLTNAAEHGMRMGQIVEERLESLFLAQHASWTNFGQEDLDGTGTAGTTAITVSTANIESIIRQIKATITTANGYELAKKFGIAFVWRPNDFAKLEEAMASQGFQFADKVLVDGIFQDGVGVGKYAFGAWHYVSTKHAAGHIFAGVRKIQQIGLLKSTYGKIFFHPNAVDGNGPLSGVSWETRLDYDFNTKAGLTAITLDVNVA
jgi:hypothetical protein